MKQRQDFVSNSSSCSFIIQLQTQRDVDEIKKIFDVLNKQTRITSYLSCNKGYFTDDYGKEINNKDKLEKDTFLHIYVGEDHDMPTIDLYHQIEDLVSSSIFKFKVYQDPGAHYTFGKKYTKKS